MLAKRRLIPINIRRLVTNLTDAWASSGVSIGAKAGPVTSVCFIAIAFSIFS